MKTYTGHLSRMKTYHGCSPELKRQKLFLIKKYIFYKKKNSEYLVTSKFNRHSSQFFRCFLRPLTFVPVPTYRYRAVLYLVWHSTIPEVLPLRLLTFKRVATYRYRTFVLVWDCTGRIYELFCLGLLFFYWWLLLVPLCCRAFYDISGPPRNWMLYFMFYNLVWYINRNGARRGFSFIIFCFICCIARQVYLVAFFFLQYPYLALGTATSY